MAHDISNLVGRIQAFEPRIIAQFSENFSSSHPDNRMNIRNSIRETLAKISLPESQRLVDLEVIPDLQDWSVSISHCETLGGWIATPRPLKVGLDIEIKSRIHIKLIERIAQPGELDGIPDPAFLWCAKESYFKALAKDQPVAVTQLRIETWQPGKNGAWNFTSSGMKGSIFPDVDLLVSVSLI